MPKSTLNGTPLQQTGIVPESRLLQAQWDPFRGFVRDLLRRGTIAHPPLQRLLAAAWHYRYAKGERADYEFPRDVFIDALLNRLGENCAVSPENLPKEVSIDTGSHFLCSFEQRQQLQRVLLDLLELRTIYTILRHGAWPGIAGMLVARIVEEATRKGLNQLAKGFLPEKRSVWIRKIIGESTASRLRLSETGMRLVAALLERKDISVKLKIDGTVKGSRDPRREIVELLRGSYRLSEKVTLTDSSGNPLRDAKPSELGNILKKVSCSGVVVFLEAVTTERKDPDLDVESILDQDSRLRQFLLIELLRPESPARPSSDGHSLSGTERSRPQIDVSRRIEELEKENGEFDVGEVEIPLHKRIATMLDILLHDRPSEFARLAESRIAQTPELHVVAFLCVRYQLSAELWLQTNRLLGPHQPLSWRDTFERRAFRLAACLLGRTMAFASGGFQLFPPGKMPSGKREQVTRLAEALIVAEDWLLAQIKAGELARPDSVENGYAANFSASETFAVRYMFDHTGVCISSFSELKRLADCFWKGVVSDLQTTFKPGDVVNYVMGRRTGIFAVGDDARSSHTSDEALAWIDQVVSPCIEHLSPRKEALDV